LVGDVLDQFFDLRLACIISHEHHPQALQVIGVLDSLLDCFWNDMKFILLSLKRFVD
jgi:hypothetical protein